MKALDSLKTAAMVTALGAAALPMVTDLGVANLAKVTALNMFSCALVGGNCDWGDNNVDTAQSG